MRACDEEERTDRQGARNGGGAGHISGAPVATARRARGMKQHRQQVRAGDPHTQRRDGFHGSRRTRGGSDGRIGHCDNSLSMEGESRDSCHLNRSESRPRLSISPAPSANTVRSAFVFHVFPGPVRPDRTGEVVVALTSTLLACHIAGRSNPLKTKGSGPRYLVEPGAGEYPQRESNHFSSGAFNLTLMKIPCVPLINSNSNDIKGSRFMPGLLSEVCDAENCADCRLGISILCRERCASGIPSTEAEQIVVTCESPIPRSVPAYAVCPFRTGSSRDR